MLALADEDVDLTEQVGELVSAPTGEVVESLARVGIEYVVLPSPADGTVAAGLDATAGLDQASAGTAPRVRGASTDRWSAEGVEGRTTWPRVAAARRSRSPPSSRPGPGRPHRGGGAAMTEPTPTPRAGRRPPGRPPPRFDRSTLLAVVIPL